jgi:hypothetical protein
MRVSGACGLGFVRWEQLSMLRRAVSWLASRDGASAKEGAASAGALEPAVEPAAAGPADADPPEVGPSAADSGRAVLRAGPPRGVMMALPDVELPHSGPVFASRAVRDAKVVGGVLVGLRAFVEGRETAEAQVQRLEALTPEQSDFLRLSLDLELADRAGALADETPGRHAAALRRLLGDLAARPLPPEPEPLPVAPAPAPVPVAVEAAAAAAPVPLPPSLDVPPPIPAIEIAAIEIAAIEVPVVEVPVLEIPVDAIPATLATAQPAPLTATEEPVAVAAPTVERPATTVRQLPRLARDAAAARRARLLDEIARDYLQ